MFSVHVYCNYVINVPGWKCLILVTHLAANDPGLIYVRCTDGPPAWFLYAIREVDKHFIKISFGCIFHQTNITYCRWRGCPCIWGKETWHHGAKSFCNLPSVMSADVIVNRTKVAAVNNILDIVSSGLNLKLFNLHLKDSWFNSAWTGL